jgi:hypothetical protein
MNIKYLTNLMNEFSIIASTLINAGNCLINLLAIKKICSFTIFRQTQVSAWLCLTEINGNSRNAFSDSPRLFLFFIKGILINVLYKSYFPHSGISSYFLLCSASGNLIKFTSSTHATNQSVVCGVVSHGIKNSFIKSMRLSCLRHLQRG